MGSDCVNFYILAFGNWKSRNKEARSDFEEEHEYSVSEIFKVMQFDGAHRGVFVCVGGGREGVIHVQAGPGPLKGTLFQGTAWPWHSFIQ